MTDLEEIKMLALKMRREFVNYAVKVLDGKRAPKPPNIQANYDKLVATLYRLFGVTEKERETMTIAELYLTVVQFIIAGVIVNAAAAVLFIIATICEYLWRSVPFESTLEYFYEFYLESFLPTMILLIMTAFVLKSIGGY